MNTTSTTKIVEKRLAEAERIVNDLLHACALLDAYVDPSYDEIDAYDEARELRNRAKIWLRRVKK